MWPEIYFLVNTTILSLFILIIVYNEMYLIVIKYFFTVIVLYFTVWVTEMREQKFNMLRLD